MADQPTEIILIGDAGAPNLFTKDPVLCMLKDLLPGHKDSVVAFLGDNIYPNGLPSEYDPRRILAEKRLKAQLDVIKNFPGSIVFLSGNHDWNKGRSNGLEYVKREEKYVEDYFGGRDVFVPSDGCPGPVEVQVNDQLALIVLNTQWWVQLGERPIGSQCNCNVETEPEVFSRLEELIIKNKGKRIIVLGHMPVYSYGVHGGRLKIRYHLFPLTLFKKRAYIPLPVLGTLMALFRRFIGLKEDLAHPRYRQFRKQIKAVLQKYPDVIYAAGHEHNLQHIQKHGNHFIVSGSGSKSQTVKTGKYSHFATRKNGFFRLLVNHDLSVDVEAWIATKDKPVKAYHGRIDSMG